MSKIFLSEKEIVDIFKNKLKIETYPKSIDSIFSNRFAKKVDYKPYYQRNYVWDEHKASYFIESVLIGSDIPPLIFFNNGEGIEVIDGRQRFETIKKFEDNELTLTKKGLVMLKQIAKKNYSELCSENGEISNIFLDSKIRIIEFEIINRKKLSKNLEDRVKKEIFSRYNSGITPLKKPDIDNAVYIDDPINDYFKQKLKKNLSLLQEIYSIFFKVKEKHIYNPPLGEVLDFMRRSLVLFKIPIRYYGRSASRADLIPKFFELLSDKSDDPKTIFDDFIHKLSIVRAIKNEFDSQNIHCNRFVFECLLWNLNILTNEGLDLNTIKEPVNINKYLKYIDDNISNFDEQNYHYFDQIMLRFRTTCDYFENLYQNNFYIYLEPTATKRDEIKEVRKKHDTAPKFDELEDLRITKPDPTRCSIDDLIRAMKRNRFLVRPPYQRSEVINITKASSIIESILLGIMLPAIFVFKRKDWVSEVIDGQQRLLTILGFMGEKYLNEDDKLVLSKNHKFKLKGLKILKELNGCKFEQLRDDFQNKIWDFELFLVEIDEKRNEKFNPVDLFVRLNDKPYPIHPNSFEMWNSWADFEIIKAIKSSVSNISDWFYIRSPKQRAFRDRMQNEELFTCLVYLDYRKTINKPGVEYLAIYQKSDRINARIKEKYDITSVLTSVSEHDSNKKEFIKSVTNTNDFINRLRKLLELNPFEKDSPDLEKSLNKSFSTKRGTRLIKRTLQDFYILWFLVESIQIQTIENEYKDIYKDIRKIFKYIKNIPEEDVINNQGYQVFAEMVITFKAKYITKF